MTDTSVIENGGEVTIISPMVAGATIVTSSALANNRSPYKETKKNVDDQVQHNLNGMEPPDGGARAWFVVISAFLCNGILFGVINTYGIIYLTLQERLMAHGDVDASSKAALVGSLTIGTTFLLSPVSGILTDKIGLRNTTFIGGLLAACGLFLSAIFVSNITILFLTYGVMFGLGAALAYTPSLAILGHYFKRYLGLVNGFVTSGSSVSTALLPMTMGWLLRNYNLEVTLCVLAVFSLFIIFCSLIYKPLRVPLTSVPLKRGQSQLTACCQSLVNVDNWKKPRYIIWAVSIPIALFGYFVPYVHMSKFVKVTFPDQNENHPIVCIGIASGIGRILFGTIADMKGVNRIYLQQLSFVILGLLTMFVPLTHSFPLLLVICLAMGIVDGCFISLLGPIAYDICGPRGATQAIGFLLGLCSIPLTVGPPIAGMLYDQTNSYKMSFILSGIPPLIGACVMCLMRFVKDDAKDLEIDDFNDQQEPLAKPAWIEETILIDANKIVLMPSNGIRSQIGTTVHLGRKASLASKGIKNSKTALLGRSDYAPLVVDFSHLNASNKEVRRYNYCTL